MIAGRLRAALVVLAVAPAAGAAALALAAVALRASGYRPRGDVLAGGSFGVAELALAWALGLLPGALMALAAAAPPPERPGLRRWGLAILGLPIGISPVGWPLAAALVPPGGNSLSLPLSLAAAAASTLACILALESRAARALAPPARQRWP